MDYDEAIKVINSWIAYLSTNPRYGEMKIAEALNVVLKNAEGKENDVVYEKVCTFIVNNLGINLCSVKDVIVQRTSNGELEHISISFIPSK